MLGLAKRSVPEDASLTLSLKKSMSNAGQVILYYLSCVDINWVGITRDGALHDDRFLQAVVDSRCRSVKPFAQGGINRPVQNL